MARRSREKGAGGRKPPRETKKEFRLEQIGWVNVGTEDALVHGHLYGSRDEAAYYAGFGAFEQVPAYIKVPETPQASAKAPGRSRPKSTPQKRRKA